MTHCVKGEVLPVKEKDIETAILTWLNYQPNVFAFKVNTAGFFDTKRKVFRKNTSPFLLRGTSDILCTASFYGIPICICLEVKTAKGVQSENQVHFQSLVESKANGFYFVVRSIKDVEQALLKVSQSVSLKIKNTDL